MLLEPYRRVAFRLAKNRQNPYTLANMGVEQQRDFAKRVVRRLRMAGFQAFWAGGCVRDMLRGVKPNDYDIATSAKPMEVKKLFGRALMIGAKFGVVVVLGPDTQVEVATFRCDLAYKDGRRPQSIVYSDAEHDALRRDFTINGMFYDPFEDKVIDYVGGQVDLRRKVVRSIGQARLRFREDHLRMLRAIRFACRFDFALEDSTARAIAEQAEDIKRISVERVADELLKILQDSGRARGIFLAGELGLLKVILPEVDYSCAVQRLARLKGASASAGLACLLYGLDQTYQPKQSGEQARAIARRFKLSSDLVEKVAWLSETVRALVVQQSNIEQISLARLKGMLASGIFDELIWLYSTVGPDKAAAQLRGRCGQIAPEDVHPAPLLNGKDLQEMGLRSGPRMGECLEALYEAQLNEQIKTKAQAQIFVRDWL